MLNEKMYNLGAKSSVIREIFEYGKKRKAEIGEENVYDFSLGNPSVPSPDEVNNTLIKLISEKDPTLLHGYTSAPGDITVRKAIADYINKTHRVSEKAENIFLTCGAAASLTISLRALIKEGEEVIVFTPFFPEYKVFVENAGGALRTVNCTENDFQPNIEELEKAINKNTGAIIINSPNNPTGAVISEKTLLKLCNLMKKKE